MWAGRGRHLGAALGPSLEVHSPRWRPVASTAGAGPLRSTGEGARRRPPSRRPDAGSDSGPETRVPPNRPATTAARTAGLGAHVDQDLDQAPGVVPRPLGLLGVQEGRLIYRTVPGVAGMLRRAASGPRRRPPERLGDRLAGVTAICDAHVPFFAIYPCPVHLAPAHTAC